MEPCFFSINGKLVSKYYPFVVEMRMEEQVKEPEMEIESEMTDLRTAHIGVQTKNSQEGHSLAHCYGLSYYKTRIEESEIKI